VLTSETGHLGVVLSQDQTQHPQSEGINKADIRFYASATVQIDQVHIRMTTTLVCVCVVPMHGVEVKSWSYVKYTLKKKKKKKKKKDSHIAPLWKIALAHG